MALREDEEAGSAITSTETREEDIRPDSHAKDEFKDLAASFKDSLNGLNTDQLKQQLAEIHLANASNDAAQRADQDVKQKRESLSAATLIYRNERRDLKLKARLITRHLSDGGDSAAEQVTKNEEAAKTLASM